uniref:Uncharacterized protein n=1 Tax=Anas platyrhynchos TaxID=8839 RepID=A0A8B9SKF2_ANAPL
FTKCFPGNAVGISSALPGCWLRNRLNAAREIDPFVWLPTFCNRYLKLLFLFFIILFFG